MDSQISKLLDSTDPSDRKRAIKLLAQSGDASALTYLSALYKTENDPEIKDLALKAGRYIKTQQQAPKWEGRPASEPADDKPKEVRAVVTEANERKSHDLLDRAMNLFDTDEVKAREEVRKAYKLNPNLKYDVYYRGLIGQVMDMRAEDAIELLESDNDVKEKTKRKNKENTDDVSWGTAFIDLALFGLVIMGLCVVGAVLGLAALRPLFDEFATSMQAASMAGDPSFAPMGSINGVLSSFIGVGVVVAALYGAVVGLLSVVTLFFQNVFVHFGATMILGGDGSLPKLIHKTTLFYIFMYIVSGVLSAASFYVTFTQTMVPYQNMSVEQLNALSANDVAMSSPNSPLALISFAVSLFFIFYLIKLIADTYEFSWIRGCFAQLIAMFIWFALSCGCIFFFTSVLASSFASTLSTVLTSTPLR